MKENNILLAEFLGWEDNQDDSFETSFCWEDSTALMPWNVDRFDFKPENMQFLEDWNWIMLVVDKIESLGFETSLTDKTFFIRIGGSNTQAGIMYTNKIEAVYNSCIEFVKWYNK